VEEGVEKENIKKADREALMESYGYRNKGMVGIIRLYCRQLFSLALNGLAGMAPPPELRVALQRVRGVKIGKNVYLGFNVYIDHLHPDLVTIEDQVTIGHRSMVYTHSNAGWNVEMKEKYFPSYVAPVTMKRGAWVTTGCTILAGVTIGEVSVVGAGSVVRRDVPPYTLVAGNPARVIRKLEPRTGTHNRFGSPGEPRSTVE